MDPGNIGTCSAEDECDPKIVAWKSQLLQKLLGEWVADAGGYKNSRLIVTEDGLEVNGRLLRGPGMLKFVLHSDWVAGQLDTWRTKLLPVEELDRTGLPDFFQSLTWNSEQTSYAITWSRIGIETVKITIPGPRWMKKYDCYKDDASDGHSIEISTQPFTGVSRTPLIEDMGSISVQQALDISQKRIKRQSFAGSRWRVADSTSTVEIVESPASKRCLGVIPFGAIVVLGSGEYKRVGSPCVMPILPKGAVNLNMFEPVPEATPCRFSDPAFSPTQMLSCPLCNSYFQNASVVAQIVKHTKIPLACSSCHALIDTSLEWSCLVCTSARHESAFYIICIACAPPQIPRTNFPRRVEPYSTRKKASPA